MLKLKCSGFNWLVANKGRFWEKKLGGKASHVKNKQKAGVGKRMQIAELSKEVCNLIFMYILRWSKRWRELEKKEMGQKNAWDMRRRKIMNSDNVQGNNKRAGL